MLCDRRCRVIIVLTFFVVVACSKISSQALGMDDGVERTFTMSDKGKKSHLDLKRNLKLLFPIP